MTEMTNRVPAGLFVLAGALLHKYKYEFLLVALLLHLFSAVAFTDIYLYSRYIWPFNMLLLGLFSLGIFADRSKAHRRFKNLIYLLVVAFPVLVGAARPTADQMIALSVCYVVFFLVILVEVLRYLIRPSYINRDIVVASTCGLLLLLETSIFLMQGLYYALPGSFRGVDATSFTTVYLDLVYFCSIVITSIGFGDITPSHHIAKLATAIVGITGQTYSVVLVGILISKYTSVMGQTDRRTGS